MWRRDVPPYATPQQLLDMEKHDPAELMRRFKQALDHVCQTGRLRLADLQLPIRLGPFDTSISSVAGYEGGEFDPEKLGVACILVPPTEGRGSNAKGSSWSVNPDGAPSNVKATSEPGLLELRMSVRKRAGKVAPKLDGKYIKFMLEKPPVDFLVPGMEQAANSSDARQPFVLMHMPKLRTRASVAPEPPTAVDEAHTPTDARLTAASEITPEDPLEQVTGLVEHHSLTELPPADAPLPAPPEQATRLNFSLLGMLSFLVAVSRLLAPSPAHSRSGAIVRVDLARISSFACFWRPGPQRRSSIFTDTLSAHPVRAGGTRVHLFPAASPSVAGKSTGDVRALRGPRWNGNRVAAVNPRPS